MTLPLATTRRSHRLRTGLLIALPLVAAALAAIYYTTLQPVTVAVDGEQHEIRTGADSVAEALSDAGVALLPADAVNPPPDAPLERGMRIAVQRANMVALRTEKDWQWVRTQSGQPLDILAENSITPGEHDVVEVNGQPYATAELKDAPWRESIRTLRVRRGAAIQVIDDEAVRWVYTAEAEVGRALDAAALKLYLGDRVVPDPSAPVEEGMVVRIERALPLTLIADGERIATRAVGPTVGDALAAIGVAPVGQDYTVPSLDTPLSAHMTIRVVRVAEQLVSKEDRMPFTTIYRTDGLHRAAAWPAPPGAEAVRHARNY